MFCQHACMFTTHMPGACRCQDRVKLKLQRVVSHCLGAGSFKPGSSARPVSALNDQGHFPGPSFLLKIISLLSLTLGVGEDIHEHTCACKHAMVHVWRSEGSLQKLVLSSTMGSGAQAIRFA